MSELISAVEEAPLNFDAHKRDKQHCDADSQEPYPRPRLAKSLRCQGVLVMPNATRANFIPCRHDAMEVDNFSSLVERIMAEHLDD